MTTQIGVPLLSEAPILRVIFLESRIFSDVCEADFFFLEPSMANSRWSSREVLESLGVLLPGDSASGLCQLAVVTCSGFSLVSR